MQSDTVTIILLGLATVAASYTPFQCPGPLLPNDGGPCASRNIIQYQTIPVSLLLDTVLFAVGIGMWRQLKHGANSRTDTGE